MAEGDFTTIDAQRDMTRQHIGLRGGEFIREYSDPGKSGTNLNRPGWETLYNDAKAGLFDVVCVTYLSRLGRGNAGTAAEFLLDSIGVQVEYIKEDFGSGKDGFVQKSVARLVDGMYVENVRAMTKSKMEQMVANGYVCGGHKPPFGYKKEPVPGISTGSTEKRVPQRFVPDPDTAPITRAAFDLFVDTRSHADVRDYLISVTGQAWDFDRVGRVLRNDAYRGVMRFGEWVNYTSHEAIITEAVWDAAQAADQSRTKRPKQKPVENFPFYLRGRVRCPHCDCKMTPVWGHGTSATVFYYECIRSKKKLTECPVRRVNARTLHDSVLHEIERAANHPTRLRSLIAEAVKALPEMEDLSRVRTDTARRLRDVEKRLKSVQDIIEEGGPSAYRSFSERLESLEKERAGLAGNMQDIDNKQEARAARRPDAAEVSGHWQKMLELWKLASEEEREAFLQEVVVGIDMNEKTKGSCDLVLDAQLPFVKIEPTTQSSAGARLELATFGL